jgi:hypothetical protein
MAGLEPARPDGQQILSLQRLPFRHIHAGLEKRSLLFYKKEAKNFFALVR